MIEDPKFPDSFKGWKPLYPIMNNKYLVLESPDGTKEVCLHLEDNDVVGIKDKFTGARGIPYRIPHKADGKPTIRKAIS